MLAKWEEIYHEWSWKKNSFTLISDFYWKDVFRPSFIGRFYSKIKQIFDVGDTNKDYEKTKFKLIIVPVDNSEHTDWFVNKWSF